ncbi:hypothetical protein NBRC116598_25080 [Pseudophaeobacter arcticus]|uniref:Uncharacterized protein n=1 Tax=Pseudophaeobacter arcticus TaxID=385492 RepID=A0ABQ0AMK0_9RHOB
MQGDQQAGGEAVQDQGGHIPHPAPIGRNLAPLHDVEPVNAPVEIGEAGAFEQLPVSEPGGEGFVGIHLIFLWLNPKLMGKRRERRRQKGGEAKTW